MTTEKKEYTKQEKLDYFDRKLTAAMAAGGASKDMFERIYYAEQVKWLLKQVYRIMASE